MNNLLRHALAKWNLHRMLVLPMLLLTGCEFYQSTAPWWPQKSNINVPGIEGRWVSQTDPKKSYRVKWMPASRCYFVDISVRHEGTYQALVTFTRANHQLVADATSRAGQEDILRLPVHMPFPVSMQGNEASLFTVSNEAMKSATAENHVRVYQVKYSDDDKRHIICTNSSEKLFQILRHALAMEDVSHRTAFDKLRKQP